MGKGKREREREMETTTTLRFPPINYWSFIGVLLDNSWILIGFSLDSHWMFATSVVNGFGGFSPDWKDRAHGSPFLLSLSPPFSLSLAIFQAFVRLCMYALLPLPSLF
jgi:hypothetical protein